jgi:hypothetical protein
MEIGGIPPHILFLRAPDTHWIGAGCCGESNSVLLSLITVLSEISLLSCVPCTEVNDRMYW